VIKAVIFDIDGVLIDSFEANLLYFQDLMPRAGYNAPTRKEYIPLFSKSLLDVIKILTRSQSEEEVKRIWDLGASREIPYNVGLVTMPKRSDVTIKKLSEKYLLGIVTSRIRGYAFEVPKLADLRDYFKVSVTYEDTAKHKPDPEPLLLAAEKLGVKPDEIVYVGDAASDVKAAKAAGMKMVAFPKELEGADAFTDSFEKLPELISAL